MVDQPPLPVFVRDLQFVNPRTGKLTETAFRVLDSLRAHVTGTARIINCTYTYDDTGASDVYTLTPVENSPLISGYTDFDIYSFLNSDISFQNVEASVVLLNGTVLSTLPVMLFSDQQAAAVDVFPGLVGFVFVSDYISAGNDAFQVTNL